MIRLPFGMAYFLGRTVKLPGSKTVWKSDFEKIVDCDSWYIMGKIARWFHQFDWNLHQFFGRIPLLSFMTSWWNLDLMEMMTSLRFYPGSRWHQFLQNGASFWMVNKSLKKWCYINQPYEKHRWLDGLLQNFHKYFFKQTPLKTMGDESNIFEQLKQQVPRPTQDALKWRASGFGICDA